VAAEAPVTRVPGVGVRAEEALARLGVRTAGDLLLHYPARWVDRRELRPFGSLTAFDALEVAGEDGRPRKPVITALARVLHAAATGSRHPRAQRLVVRVQDETGRADLVFFGGHWRRPHFPEGAEILISGPVGFYRGSLQFPNPDYEVLNREEEAGIHTGRLFPVYPLTRGLTQRRLREWVRFALDHVLPGLADPLPETLRRRHRLPELHRALADLHFPESREARDAARRRLAFDEFLLDQLFVRAARLRREQGKVSRPVQAGGARYRRILAALPFRLTPDQETALAEILADLGRTRPANRLLQGDVGSGKTVVALLAAAAAADSDLQTAFLVPTEILAEQHYRTLRDLGGGLGLLVRLLTGGTPAAARREVLRVLADGSCPLVVGTHALFQDDVRFRRLGLVVVDEQHRFGVLQRVAMMEKGESPHVLVMSATPIPRSLALVRYADLDLSVLRHRPRGRGRVITRVTPEENRDKVYAFLAERLREGRQAFIVYPLVEDSERTAMRAATTMAKQLAARPEFRDHEVALLHGQMKSEEKDAAMKRFAAGETQVLVATTVIEVGIDVPNASFLIVEHPERYGLSQLHQLRGRIGRGEHSSYCVLIRDAGLDGAAVERLERFAGTEDGFELAALDLSLRGQGDLAGTRQSGRPVFRLADPIRDRELCLTVAGQAREILDAGTLLGEGGPEWEPLRCRLRDMLEAAGALVDAG